MSRDGRDIEREGDGEGEGDRDGDGEQEGERERTFTARIESIKTITDVLTCLCENQKKDQLCHVEVTQDAINFAIKGRAKATEARANLDSMLFEELLCDRDGLKFAINLPNLLDCLQLFGSSAADLGDCVASFDYSSADALLRLTLEGTNVITVCEITTSYVDEDDDDIYSGGLVTAFRNSAEQSQLIVKAEPLRDVITELGEVSGVKEVKIQVSKHPEMMKLTAKGNMGTCEIEFPRSSEVFVSFRADVGSSWTYSLPALELGMKALSVANETFIRFNAEGIMCIQHQIETTRGVETFVDFLALPMENQDDKNESEGEGEE
jgi:hypothetical protein